MDGHEERRRSLRSGAAIALSGVLVLMPGLASVALAQDTEAGSTVAAGDYTWQFSSSIEGLPEERPRLDHIAVGDDGTMIMLGGTTELVSGNPVTRSVRAWSSADGGMTWTPEPFPADPVDSVTAVAAVEGGFVAVGQSFAGDIFKRGDGRIWERGADGTWSRPFKVKNATIRFVEASPSGPVVAGATFNRRGQPKGRIWTKDGQGKWKSKGLLKKSRAADALAISPDGTYVAVSREPFTGKGDSGGQRVWRSDGGKSWKQVKIPGLKGIFVSVSALVWTPSGFIVVVFKSQSRDNEHKVWRSTDGKAWQNVAVIDPTPGGWTFATADGAISLDRNGRLFRTANGTDWIEGQEPKLASPFQVVTATGTADGRIVGIGNDLGIDETTWSVFIGTPVGASTSSGAADSGDTEVDQPS